jgi:hypothetical protein
MPDNLGSAAQLTNTRARAGMSTCQISARDPRYARSPVRSGNSRLHRWRARPRDRTRSHREVTAVTALRCRIEPYF